MARLTTLFFDFDKLIPAMGLLTLVGISVYSFHKSGEIVKNSENRLVKVSVSIEHADAKQIKISGSFNNWREFCCLEKKKDSDIWEMGLTLKPGVYEYILIVDGKPYDDGAGKKLRDGMGGKNRILYVNEMPVRKGDGNA